MSRRDERLKAIELVCTGSLWKLQPLTYPNMFRLVRRETQDRPYPTYFEFHLEDLTIAEDLLKRDITEPLVPERATFEVMSHILDDAGSSSGMMRDIVENLCGHFHAEFVKYNPDVERPRYVIIPENEKFKLAPPGFTERVNRFWGKYMWWAMGSTIVLGILVGTLLVWNAPASFIQKVTAVVNSTAISVGILAVINIWQAIYNLRKKRKRRRNK